jgi:hypothetical protein
MARSDHKWASWGMLTNFGAMHFEATLDDEKISPFIQQKAELNEAIERQKNAVEALEKCVKKRRSTLM